MTKEYITEVIIQSTNGATTTIKSVEDVETIGNRIFQTDGYSTLVDVVSDEDTHTIVNLTNVCCITLQKNKIKLTGGKK